MTGDTTASDSRLTRRQRTILSLVAVVCIVLAGAALVAAQQDGYTEGWEDGNLDGYDVVEESPAFSEVNSDNPSEGSNALYQEIESSSLPGSVETTVTTNDSYNLTFDGGTILRYDVDADLQNQFGGGDESTINTELRIEGGDGDNLVITFGTLRDDTTESGYDMRGSAVGPPSGNPSGTSVDTDGYDTVALVYMEGTQEVELYVDGSLESTQDYLGFGDTGNMTVGYGLGTVASSDGSESAAGYVYYDDIAVGGNLPPPGTPSSEDLDLDVPKYMGHNETAHYTVEANQSGTWTDVTDQAEIAPGYAEAVTFYPSNGTVHSTNDTSINEQFNVTADYDGLQDSETMTVASADVENLDLLPTWWKVNATVGDGMMLWLIVATLAAVVATRAATPFAGVGAYVMFMIAGWMTGSVSDGVVIAAILTGLFLGLNLAANVDTTIRGSG